MQRLSLQVKNWSAWVPGIDQCETWSDWSLELAAGCSDSKADVGFIKPLVRRRLSAASRIALRVAQDCLGAETTDAAVFCSRHGECVRTLDIYRSIATGTGVSPMQFSQSVHNTAAGVFSIERGLEIPMTALAAGHASVEAGFVEAWSQLSGGLSSVLLVMADEHLCAPYAASTNEPQLPFGLALLLEAQGNGPALVLEPTKAKGRVTGGTDNLLALLTGQPALQLDADNGWRWQLHEG